MSLADKISTSFASLNISVEDQVLQKCCSICTTNGVDAETFVDVWLAFTVSSLNGAPPTLDALDHLERKEFSKKSQVVSTPKSKLPLPDPEPIRTPRVDAPSKTFGECSVVLEFGDCKGGPSCTRALKVEVLNGGIATDKYMMERFLMRRKAINNVTKLIVDDILRRHGLELTKRKLEAEGEMVVGGRVYSNDHGMMKSQSVVLEAMVEHYEGHSIRLDLSTLPNVTLFSGQCVVVKGTSRVSYFAAEALFTEVSLPPLPQPKLEETVKLVVAAGPFTTPDNVLYEPLKELLQYVLNTRPNFLILIGPFIEGSHKVLQTMNIFYGTFFEDLVAGIMEKLGDTRVQVILVPSPNDAGNHVIFPTPPFHLKKSYPNLILAPNPFNLNIEGLNIVGSSVDILFHLGRREFYKGQPTGERMTRLVSQIFTQRCLYPLLPPNKDIFMDYQFLEKYGMIGVSPHLMILPSTFRYFVKHVDGCLVVNPERAVKGCSGGTFASVEIQPGIAPLDQRISCQIVHI